MEKFCTQLTGPAFDGHFGLVVPYVFALGEKKMNVFMLLGVTCLLSTNVYYLYCFVLFAKSLNE